MFESIAVVVSVAVVAFVVGKLVERVRARRSQQTATIRRRLNLHAA